MKIAAIAAFVTMLACPLARAGGDGLVAGTGSVEGVNSPAGLDLVDAWNDNEPPASFSYGATCFGFEYTPSISYTLHRIEWYAGDIAGEVSTTILSGGFGGTVLGSVTYNESPPRSWQGADFAAPVSLTAGTTYSIIYDVVQNALGSIAESGTIIPHWPSSNCTNFSGPFSTVAWMARFYGMSPVSVESDTWGRIKSTYR